MLVASAIRRTASSLNSMLNLLLAFFAIALLHYSRELVVYIWSLDKVWGKLPVLEAAAVRTAEIV